MAHNVRVLCLQSDLEIVNEMKSVDVEEAGIRHMLPKSRHYLVKIESVRRPIAHILKETFLSNGGDAAVSRNIITATVNESDVLLSGTRKQYQRALLSLAEQGFGCKELASEIEAAIRHYDSTPNVANYDNASLNNIMQSIGKRTLIMGILNITPDSFSDGGKYLEVDAAVSRAIEMAELGADIIDIGGESTRPGAEPLSEQEEINRVIPVIKKVSDKVNVPISIDTYKSNVAREALENGASIVNDISAATFDKNMPNIIAEKNCPVIIMHIKGTPQNMQLSPTYKDLMGEIYSFLKSRIVDLVSAGVDEKSIIIDPGFGFGKTVEHNLEIIRRLRELKSLGRPILVGTSRKSTIGKVLGDLPIEERIEGTAATVALSIANGADIIRVHDVKEMARVARMTDTIVRK